MAPAQTLSANFESSVPSLYFVGLASANTFGPVMRFTLGAGYTARRLAWHLATSTKSGTDPRHYACASGRGWVKGLWRMQASQAPAVVVGAGTCGLGLVRSLGRGNVPIIVVDTSPIEPAMHSRFGRPVVVSALSGRPLVDELTALAKFLNGPAVLFLTSDEMVLTVSEFRTTLEKTYRFSLPDHKSLIALMSKGGFQKFAEANGFPVPLSLTIGQAAKFEALSKLTFPCIVKPAIKNEVYVSHQFPRAYKVTTEADAEAVCRLLLSVVPSVVVQEWVEGPDSEIFFCLQYRSADGRTISSFTGRKLSIWPPDVGVTVSCTAALEAQPILQPLTEAFF